jgi:membrane protease subunit (stomatin/prohibitin family)
MGAMGGAAVAAIGMTGQAANRLKDALGKAVNRQDSGKSSTSPASTQDDPVKRLKKLKQMFEAGLITQGEFDTKKAEILTTL